MPRTTKGADGGKRYPLNMRTTRETRERLEAAAIASGRSLVQEVEFRLERSFVQENALGGPEMMRLAFQMAAAFAVETQGEDWAADLAAYARGTTAVIRALIRGVPAGSDQRLARQAIVSSLLTLMAQDEEQEK
jgi:TraY domain